ncbi:MAG: RNA 2',3'-cyclic phosphodiesterase [Anaerolineae bacterium]|nr:RNA 2',3'-cyclic phosphodiesterase [Anaerolineae bacterium]
MALTRLFTAIELPEAVQKSLLPLCAGVPGARWSRREQMHLTLRFIGEVDEAQFAAIREALKRARVSPFGMALKGVGQFPPRGAPRVLWVGVQAEPGLGQLYTHIQAALKTTGIAEDTRPYAPHITLARLKNAPPPESVRQFLARHGGYESDAIVADAFTLYSSVLAPGGATYRVEARYILGD